MAKSLVLKKGQFKSLMAENNEIPVELHGNHGVYILSWVGQN